MKYHCTGCDATMTAPTDTDTIRCPGCGRHADKATTTPTDELRAADSLRTTAPVHRAAALREAATLLEAHASTLELLSSSDYDNEAFAASHLRTKAADPRRMADEAQQTAPAVTEERQQPTPRPCTDPCIACMTDESHDPAVTEEPGR